MKGLLKSFFVIGIFCLMQVIYAKDKNNCLDSNRHKIFKFIKPYLPHNPVILEAGSFNGTDTVHMSQFWPEAYIHAFEPVPEVYKILKNKTKGIPKISTYPFALSNRNGFATFHLAEAPQKAGVSTGSGSLLAPKEHLKYSDAVFPGQITVETLTLDQWASIYNIDHIDFMWLDMQGHELTALKHALTILPSVTMIYTEVEFVEAFEGQPLYKDVKEWLGLQGFELLATDFDEAHAALGNKIPVKNQWFGNALFYKKSIENEV